MDQDQAQELLKHLRGIRRVIINNCHGGFGLSRDAWVRYCMKRGWDPDDRNLHPRLIDRDDPDLVQVVRDMGPSASDRLSRLKIVEIPQDVEWQIEEYDGLEWVAEKHRTWR